MLFRSPTSGSISSIAAAPITPPSPSSPKSTGSPLEKSKPAPKGPDTSIQKKCIDDFFHIVEAEIKSGFIDSNAHQHLRDVMKAAKEQIHNKPDLADRLIEILLFFRQSPRWNELIGCLNEPNLISSIKQSLSEPVESGGFNSVYDGLRDKFNMPKEEG